MTEFKEDKKNDSGLVSPVDFFDITPTKIEKMELRKSSKKPSDWLKLLCTCWANKNLAAVEATNAKLLEFKPFLKGKLSSQLLCRLSIPDLPKQNDAPSQQIIDFWKSLGIENSFDRTYIVSQVERFCTFYNIRGLFMDEEFPLGPPIFPPPFDMTAATMGISSLTSPISIPPYPMANGMDAATAAAATAYAAAAAASVRLKAKSLELAKAQTKPYSFNEMVSERINDRKYLKTEQRRLGVEKKEARIKEREAANIRKAADKAARDATREERRQKKILMRLEREKYVKKQKDAALRRAADLVRSNRVPIEITRGAAAAQAAADAAVAAVVGPLPPAEPSKKKARSAIVVSTANDLHQIVTHSRNLWTKYNAIAREHNQKVNWITVAKELGIHVKVREKYARMYARAEQRGFCFQTCGHYKIKDHPHIFLEPSCAERKLLESTSMKDTVDTSVYGEGHSNYESTLGNNEESSTESSLHNNPNEQDTPRDIVPQPSPNDVASAVQEAIMTDHVEVTDADPAFAEVAVAVVKNETDLTMVSTESKEAASAVANLSAVSTFTKVYPATTENNRDATKT
mmetsp:Transcript_14179/g.13680  ORF Transcript_14179/g.13680 Transcript_14179/m.13680 type:complete len:574 (-) Transcript_14179:298-2019(-)